MFHVKQVEFRVAFLLEELHEARIERRETMIVAKKKPSPEQAGADYAEAMKIERRRLAKKGRKK